MATHGMMRRYVAVDNDGLINEKRNPNTDTIGMIRDLHIPRDASRLLISADVISGFLVRCLQWTRKKRPRPNILAWKIPTATCTLE